MTLLESWRAVSRFQRRAETWRRIVFFAESRQDWHHLAPLVDRLTGLLGRSVCYLTSDAEDFAFARENERLRVYHVPAGWPLMLAFKALRADLLVLTMMDLGNLQLRRSAHPVHYLYVFHSLGSTHMVDCANSYDHYDTLLCAGPHQMREIQRREEREGLPPKQLIAHGYARLEDLIARAAASTYRRGTPLSVLVAPTWGPQSLLPVCGRALIEVLLEAGFRVIVRPHYETQRQSPEVIRAIRDRFEAHSRFEYVDRMGDVDTLLRSDVLVSDWSAMAIEYSLGLVRPVLFVDVPPRVRNPRYRELDLEPLEVSIRERVGGILPPDALGEAPARILRLVSDQRGLAERIDKLRGELVFNPGSSAEVGAQVIACIADEQSRGRRTP